MDSRSCGHRTMCTPSSQAKAKERGTTPMAEFLDVENPKDRNGEVMRCHTEGCNSDEHVVANCLMRNKGKGQGGQDGLNRCHLHFLALRIPDA